MWGVEGIFELDHVTFELVNFFEPREIFIEGKEMIRRAMTLDAILCFHYVNFVLDRSDKIPELCDAYDLVFAGAKCATKKVEHDGGEFVAYLRKIRGLWRLGYGSIAFDWDERARLLRRRYDLAA